MSHPEGRAVGAIALLALLCCALPALAVEEGELDWRHGYAYFGELEYPADFEHFRWVEPDAPKGGRIVLPGRQRYTSFNPIAGEGQTVTGVGLGAEQSYLYDPLLEPAADEISSAYGRLAEAIAITEDGAEVWFRLRPQARFHDGEPITARDVEFAFEMIKEHGSASLRDSFRDVTGTRVHGEHTIAFEIAAAARDDANMPLRLGDLIALPSHYWEHRDFASARMQVPLGSGPYRIGTHSRGSSVEWERVEDYWGRDLPVNRGRFNFDVVRYDYFLDIYVARESVRANTVDIIQDTIATTWVTAWDVESVDRGQLLRYPAEVRRPYGVGWVAFLMNLRAGPFQDRRVRKAFWLCRDFPWFNEVQQFGVNERAESHFTGTPFEARGLPSERELELLRPLRDEIPQEVFSEGYASPPSVLDGKRRAYLLEADRLLKEAGWVVRDGTRVHAETGEPLAIDFPFGNALGMMIAALFVENLERLGIEVSMQQMESTRYLNVLREGDYDVTLTTVISNLIPGAELRNRYHSSVADVTWSTNWVGLRDPAVDELIETVEQAGSLEEHLAAVQALDRVLLWNYYMIPGFYPPHVFLVHWNRFGRPEHQGAYRIGYPDTWWFDAERAARIEADEELEPPPRPRLVGDELFRRTEREAEVVER